MLNPVGERPIEQARNRPKGRLRAVAQWLLGAGVVALAALALNHWFATRPIPFERAAWDATRGSLSDKTSHRMADDLIASNALIGKTPAEVVQLLGEPDAPAFHAEYWNMTFALGPCRHMVGIDSEFLALRLDARGTVSQAAIVED